MNRERERRVLQQGGGAGCFLSWGRGQWKGWCQSQEQWTIDDADFEIEQVDSGSSVGPCPQPDTSSVDTADSYLVSLSQSDICRLDGIGVVPRNGTRERLWNRLIGRRSSNFDTHEFELSMSTEERFAWDTGENTEVVSTSNVTAHKADERDIGISAGSEFLSAHFVR